MAQAKRCIRDNDDAEKSVGVGGSGGDVVKRRHGACRQ